MATNINTKKQEIYKYVELSLGGGMVDVEQTLTPDHYESALNTAFTKFRQRSENSVEESYVFLPTVIDQNDYILPNEVMEVRKIFQDQLDHAQAAAMEEHYLNHLTLHTQIPTY